MEFFFDFWSKSEKKEKCSAEKFEKKILENDQIAQLLDQMDEIIQKIQTVSFFFKV